MSGQAAPPRVRDAGAADALRIGEIARAAYLKYVPRIGREPAPMGADFAAEIAAGRVVVVEADASVVGYMVAWPEADGYFIDNIAVDPAEQGRGLGRELMDHAERAARRHGLTALRLYQRGDERKSRALSPPGVRRDPSRDRAGIQPRLHATRPCDDRERAVSLARVGVRSYLRSV